MSNPTVSFIFGLSIDTEQTFEHLARDAARLAAAEPIVRAAGGTFRYLPYGDDPGYRDQIVTLPLEIAAEVLAALDRADALPASVEVAGMDSATFDTDPQVAAMQRLCENHCDVVLDMGEAA